MKSIKIYRKIKNFFIQLLITAIAIIVIALIILIYEAISFLYSYFNLTETDILIFILIIVLIPFFFIITFHLIKNRKSIEGEMIKIVCLFLERLKYTPDKITETLTRVFPQYNPSKILKLYNKTKSNKFDKNTPFSIISKEKHKTRLYTAYLLLEISGFDAVLTIEEEKIILDFIRKLKIQKNIFNTVKQSFVKKGLKEERKILEEQNRRKLINQFSRFMLPYEAYRIMGISPSVTKAQLKKTYRTLAKKYHPDKYAGKSDAEIQKAEEKFQEIKEAYDVILKNKKY